MGGPVNEPHKPPMYIWAVMHAFKQESISFFRTVREAKREFKALLVRVSAALFGDCCKDTMKLFKRGGKDIAKAWKLHPYHNELRLTFPLRKYILIVTQSIVYRLLI